MMLLKHMPILLSVHFLYLFTKTVVFILNILESTIEPLEFTQHVVTFLFPESSSYLNLVIPAFFLIGIHIKLTMFSITISGCSCSLR